MAYLYHIFKLVNNGVIGCQFVSEYSTPQLLHIYALFLINGQQELGTLANCFGNKKYRYDILLEDGGSFCSCAYGYHTNESFSNIYDGKCVPEEFCVLTNPNDLDD